MKLDPIKIIDFGMGIGFGVVTASMVNEPGVVKTAVVIFMAGTIGVRYWLERRMVESEASIVRLITAINQGQSRGNDHLNKGMEMHNAALVTIAEALIERGILRRVNNADELEDNFERDQPERPASGVSGEMVYGDWEGEGREAPGDEGGMESGVRADAAHSRDRN